MMVVHCRENSGLSKKLRRRSVCLPARSSEPFGRMCTAWIVENFTSTLRATLMVRIVSAQIVLPPENVVELETTLLRSASLRLKSYVQCAIILSLVLCSFLQLMDSWMTVAACFVRNENAAQGVKKRGVASTFRSKTVDCFRLVPPAGNT